MPVQSNYDIILINLPLESYSNNFSYKKYIQSPIGLGDIAAYLSKYGINVGDLNMQNVIK